MSHSWITELRRLASGMFICWLLGWLLGLPLWGIIIGFSVYLT